MSICVRTLGAGSEVGRSCFLVTIEDVSVLIDAGVHVNPQSKSERIPIIPSDVRISAVMITHYHLDHVGALPHLREVAETIPKDVDIFMTAPTKTLSPSVCIDYSRGPNNDLYVPNHVYRCFTSDRIKVVGCGEEVKLDSGLRFQFAHSGHVIGGVLVLIQYRNKSLVYTGDFSVIPDSLLYPIHIPPEIIPRYGVDVVISECTHATTVSPVRELVSIQRSICERVFRTIKQGGSVLIPVFAVGRMQELASMLRQHLGDTIPMYTASPAGQRAGMITTLIHRQWIREDCVPNRLGLALLEESDPFPSNSVVFASPAMMEGGASLRYFTEICEDPKNLVVLTGYCNKGTVGNSLILFASRPGTRDKTVSVLNRQFDVKCECLYVPFTNHTDSNGIVHILRQLRPRSGVVLIHGQRDKIERFRDRLRSENVVSESVDIVIPRNYESHSFSPEKSDAQKGACTGSVCMERTIALVRPLTSTELGSILSALALPFEEHEDRFTVNDPRGSSIVFIRGNELVCEWEADWEYGPVWMTHNPTVEGISHVLNERGLIGSPGNDTISISECSD
jgi:integrator complex subunit 11